MNQQTKRLFVGFSILFALACEASGQAPKSARTILDSWDRNKNGRLETSEIPPKARDKFQKLAVSKGLDFNKGVPIDQVVAVDDAESRKKAKTIKSNAENKTGKLINKTIEPKPKPPTQQESMPRAKGFGDSRPLKRASGFDASEPADAAGSPTETQSKKKEERATAKESRERKQLKILAKAMLAQHDVNKNGRLEKNEWTRLRGNPGASDRNGDGILTAEELEGHLAGYAVREKEPRASRRPMPAKRPNSTSSRKTYRFLTPQERLPEGLPTWFTDKDLNADGQLSFREYRSRLAQAELDAFRVFDLNNDGFIVAKEYLKSTD